MNLFWTLIGAIKNDIFIFRLGGLTRTATVNYYRTQDGGFSGNLASVDVLAVLSSTASKQTVPVEALIYVHLFTKTMKAESHLKCCEYDKSS